MDILFLTNLLPYPRDSGGKINTYTKLSVLSKAGHNIDLVCFTEQKEARKTAATELNQLCRSVNQIYHRLTTADYKTYMMFIAAKSLLSPYSFGLYKFRSREMARVVSRLCGQRRYDCVYFDHLQLCVYDQYIRKGQPAVKKVLDAHNCEALLMRRNADVARGLIQKAFLRLESRKLGRFEGRMLKKMDVTIVLSPADYAQLRKQSGGEFNHVIIPTGIPDQGRKEIRELREGTLNLLFLGTLTWEPNNQGLIWFLRNVMPRLLAEKRKFTLYVVGKGPSTEVQNLARQYKNVIITGYVESVDAYFDKCDCMIVPLFVGSGLRVKLIEGFSRGMPSVSTTIGAEGLEAEDCKNILFANTPEEFQKAIQAMYDKQTRERLSAGARECYEKNHSPQVLAEKLNAVMNQICEE